MHEPMTLAELAGTDGLLSDDERLIQETVRRFVREKYLPRAADLFENESFPEDLASGLAELGLLGGFIHGYGCAGMNTVAYGLALEELEYGDSALRSFVSVQSSLAMNAIHRYGTDEQRQRWLPPMQRGEVIGCFGLTEPDSGFRPRLDENARAARRRLVRARRREDVDHQCPDRRARRRLGEARRRTGADRKERGDQRRFAGS